MNLNKAMIIGNLTRDPELRNTPSGHSVASFSVATNLIWKDQAGQRQERVEYHNVVVWRRLAEICGQYLHKGSKVYIEGRLQTRDWVGQDSVKRYRTEIVADNMIMLDRAGAGAAPMGADEQPPAPNEEPVIDSNQAVGSDTDTDTDTDTDANPQEDEIKVENIPF